MSYKFNRNCWVKSLEEKLFCSGENRSPAAEPASIEEKIASAESLFSRWGDKLQEEERICRLIHRLEVDLENSRKGMHDLGIFTACARCDEMAPEGSCCSRGLEKKYSPVLLMMNLMLGAGLPQRRFRADSCYFLGSKGCVLKIRHMLCVDYLCPESEKTLGTINFL